MAFVVEMGLFAFGILLGTWWFGVVALPIVYGFPRALYWVFRGWVRVRAVILYLMSPVIWSVVFSITFILLALVLPGAFATLRQSGGFSLGAEVAVVVAVIRTLFSRSARAVLQTDFLKFIRSHLTSSGEGIVANLVMGSLSTPHLGSR